MQSSQIQMLLFFFILGMKKLDIEVRKTLKCKMCMCLLFILFFINILYCFIIYLYGLFKLPWFPLSDSGLNPQLDGCMRVYNNGFYNLVVSLSFK